CQTPSSFLTGDNPCPSRDSPRRGLSTTRVVATAPPSPAGGEREFSPPLAPSRSVPQPQTTPGSRHVTATSVAEFAGAATCTWTTSAATRAPCFRSPSPSLGREEVFACRNDCVDCAISGPTSYFCNLC